MHGQQNIKTCYGVTDCTIRAGFRAEPSKLRLERIWAELVSYSVLAIKIDWILKLTSELFVKQNTAKRIASAVCSMAWYLGIRQRPVSVYRVGKMKTGRKLR